VALEVVKLGYSRRPWRVVLRPCPAGDLHRPSRCVCELWEPEVFDHPMLGRTVIDGPLAFERKRDAVAYVNSQEKAA